MGKYVTAVSSEELRRTGALFESAATPLEAALEFAEEILHVNKSDYTVLASYTTSGIDVTHVDLKQLFHGIPIDNTSIRIHVDRRKHVCAYEDRFFRGAVSSSLLLSQFASIDTAFATLAQHVNEDPATIAVSEDAEGSDSAKDAGGGTNRAFGQKTYYHVEGGSIEPAWKFIVSLPMHEYEAYVSADGKRVINNHDRVIVG